MSDFIDFLEVKETWKTYEEEKREGNKTWWVAPAGLDWIEQGSLLAVSEDVSVHKTAWLGSMVTLGENTVICEDVMVSNDTTIGATVYVGEGVRIAAGCTVGDQAQIEHQSVLRKNASVGFRCSIGAYCRLGAESRVCAGLALGQNSQVTRGMTAVYDLGYTDGYRKTLGYVQGFSPYVDTKIAFMTAGCHAGSLGYFRAHWEFRRDRQDSKLVLALAENLAEKRGWLLHHPTEVFGDD